MNGGKAKILIVDDSAIQRNLLARLLKGQGYEIVTAGTGGEADRLIRQERPDAVLLDWDLPDIKGLDLLIRWSGEKETNGIPVIMVTGYGNPEKIRQAFDNGAVDYIRKPPEDIELMARLRTTLRIKGLQDELREISIRDPLTNLYNRRYFNERLDQEFARAKRYDLAFALTIIDIDFFKQINDRYGHDAGDQVLRQVAEILVGECRDSDIVARYGGEEFVILLPETFSPDAEYCIDRLRHLTEEKAWTIGDHSLKLTLSAGIACFKNGNFNDWNQLLTTADQGLYEAKKSGRNRVVMSLTKSSVSLDEAKSLVTG